MFFWVGPLGWEKWYVWDKGIDVAWISQIRIAQRNLTGRCLKKKKITQVILSALCPLLCNSRRPQHTLQMFADHCGPRQTIPWETINQGQLQPQGELYPIQTIFNHRSRDQLLEFPMSFYKTISSEFLVQGNFKHTQFSQEHWYWRDSNLQPLAPKVSAILIELICLFNCP